MENLKEYFIELTRKHFKQPYDIIFDILWNIEEDNKSEYLLYYTGKNLKIYVNSIKLKQLDPQHTEELIENFFISEIFPTTFVISTNKIFYDDVKKIYKKEFNL